MWTAAGGSGAACEANGVGAAGEGGASAGDGAHTPPAPPLAGARVCSLLRDYAPLRVPNVPHKVFHGHTGGVKSVVWVHDTPMIVSGGNDQQLCLWSATSGASLAVLEGHLARIWSLDASSPVSSPHALLLASAAADGAVRLWRLGDTPPPLLPDARHSRLGDTAGALHDTWSREAAGERGERRVQLAGTLSGHTGDVYSVRFHPSAPLLVTAGYDRTVRPLDHDTPSRASRPRHPSPPTTPRSPDLAGAPL